MNRRISFIILTLLGSAIYLISVNAPFIYDDIDQILFNPKLHSLFPLSNAVFCDFRQIRVALNLSCALNWVQGSGATWPFHLTNVFIHLINTLIVWSLLGQMLQKDNGVSGVSRSLLQDFTSFLFLVLPLQSEAVSYIVGGRTSLLQATGFFGTLLLFSQKERKPFLIALCVVLSLLFKESCVLIPFLLLAYELTLNGRRWDAVKWKEFSLYFGAALFIAPIYLLLKDPVGMYDGTTGFHLYPVSSYLVWQARYYLFYLWIFVNPFAQSIIHAPPELSALVVIEGALGFALCITTMVWAWRKRITFPTISFLVALFFVSLLPTNSFVQMINPFAEYRLYTSNLLLCFLLAFLIIKVIALIQNGFVRKAIAFYLAVFFLAISALQQVTWADDLRLFSRAVENYPDSYRTHLLLGGAFEEHNDLPSATAQYREALNLVKTKEIIKTYRPWILLARVYTKQKNYPESLSTLSSMHLENLQSAKPPLIYYQTYLFDLAQLKDRKSFDEMKAKALSDYPNASLPEL